MITYNYKKIKGHETKKFTENGHTMFESDVLRRLQRLAYLEDEINKGMLIFIQHSLTSDETTIQVIP